MSISGIIALVLAAVVILTLLFVFFHIFILLLPVALIAILIIWLIYWFTGRKNKKNMPSSNYNFESFNFGSEEHTRKKARNVTTKDVDDDK